MPQRFSNNQVANYYNTTQHHYERWWKLKKHGSLHYGIWEASTRNFGEALENTNRYLLKRAQVLAHHHVLDAGCGVGGAARFVHRETGAEVTGITLSERQIATARQQAQAEGMAQQVHFLQRDFCNTGLEAKSYDVVWACESSCYATDRSAFAMECFRLLKPGGRLVLCDFFKTELGQSDPKKYLRYWADTWGVSEFATPKALRTALNKAGFGHQTWEDFTPEIEKSARRMYWAACLGALPSELYNLFYPGVSPFAKTHYQSGWYQYKALTAGYWRYRMVTAIKEG